MAHAPTPKRLFSPLPSGVVAPSRCWRRPPQSIPGESRFVQLLAREPPPMYKPRAAVAPRAAPRPRSARHWKRRPCLSGVACGARAFERMCAPQLPARTGTSGRQRVFAASHINPSSLRLLVAAKPNRGGACALYSLGLPARAGHPLWWGPPRQQSTALARPGTAQQRGRVPAASRSLTDMVLYTREKRRPRLDGANAPKKM